MIRGALAGTVLMVGVAACSSAQPSSVESTSGDASENHDDGDAADGGVIVANGFVHPGVLVSKGMLDFVKQKLGAHAEPWQSALTRVEADALAQLPYTPEPRAVVTCGAFSNPSEGCTEELADAAAAYTQALLWYHSGSRKYADSAIAILNAWSSTLTAHEGDNGALQAAWAAELFPRAAEIIRYSNAGWQKSDVDRFATLLTTVFLPQLANGSSANGNTELSMSDALVNIGVFTNDRDIFDEGVALWRHRTPAYVYLSSDGPVPLLPPHGITLDALLDFWFEPAKFVDGLAQETCRDLQHTQLGLAAMINAAETASIQGVDLFSAEEPRITAALELHAGLLNGTSLPTSLCSVALSAATPAPTWEIGFNHYATTRGLALPSTSALLQKLRPTGVDHDLAWETLTHADIAGVGVPAAD